MGIGYICGHGKQVALKPVGGLFHSRRRSCHRYSQGSDDLPVVEGCFNGHSPHQRNSSTTACNVAYLRAVHVGARRHSTIRIFWHDFYFHVLLAITFITSIVRSIGGMPTLWTGGGVASAGYQYKIFLDARVAHSMKTAYFK